MVKISLMTAVAGAALMCSAASAAEYSPIAPLPTLVIDPLTSASEASDPSTTEAPAVAPLRCTTPPALNALGAANFVQTTTDMQGALAAGLPLGSMSTSATKKVLIQDWTRSANCLATDGVTELVYGQGIRLFASSEGFDVEGDVTLGMLAATSTLNNQNSKVIVSILGFNDTQLTTLGSSIFGPINVDRFATVDGLAKKMVERAASLSNGSVQRLGIVFPPSTARQHAVGAFAVQQVANGKSCDDTKARLDGGTPSQSALVASVYGEMEAPCDATAPGIVAQARAKAALGKIRVKT